MELKKASVGDYPAIYKSYVRDFPRSERKPFAVILGNVYIRRISDIYVMKEGKEMLGFAVLVSCGEDELVLLDYLATSPEVRSGGIGSKILAALPEKYPGKAGIFGEIETPGAAGDEAEDRLRSRRQGFYERNGFHTYKVKLDLFGVDMRLIYRPIKRQFDDREIMGAAERFYDAFFRNKQLRRRIRLEL